MRNEYIDIPAQPQPRQEMLWQRQRMVAELGQLAATLCDANTAYNAKVAELIALDAVIRAA